jgi:Fe-S cluster assembly iron-binding protein IscA
MNEKIKIKISENAFEKLQVMLNKEEEYSHLRFVYKNGCCGSPKVDIYLDNLKAKDIVDNIESLPIVYDIEVLEKIQEITLVYRNSSFLINTILNNKQKKDCANCHSTCNKTCGKSN